MTDRVHSLHVILNADYRSDDDCEEIVKAIFMIKGVSRVLKKVSNFETEMAKQRAKEELREKIWKLLK